MARQTLLGDQSAFGMSRSAYRMRGRLGPWPGPLGDPLLESGAATLGADVGFESGHRRISDRGGSARASHRTRWPRWTGDRRPRRSSFLRRTAGPFGVARQQSPQYRSGGIALARCAADGFCAGPADRVPNGPRRSARITARPERGSAARNASAAAAATSGRVRPVRVRLDFHPRCPISHHSSPAPPAPRSSTCRSLPRRACLRRSRPSSPTSRWQRERSFTRRLVSGSRPRERLERCDDRPDRARGGRQLRHPADPARLLRRRPRLPLGARPRGGRSTATSRTRPRCSLSVTPTRTTSPRMPSCSTAAAQAGG